MIVLLVIVSFGVLLYGYMLMGRLDRFFERGGFAQPLQAPLQKEILLYGEQPAMDEIGHMLDDQHIQYDYTWQPDIDGNAVYRWIGAFSKDDADNLLICMMGKRRNSAVRTIAACNDTLPCMRMFSGRWAYRSSSETVYKQAGSLTILKDEYSRMIFWGKFKTSSTQLIALGFLLIILLGALVLSLPAANRPGQRLQFLDALFTATSATCVTGLVVHDTYTQFSLFGQIVILLLIQIGGLGFMTVATLFLMMAKRRIGLAERGVLAETVSAFHIGGIVRLIRRILLCVGIFELTGAILLYIRFAPQMGAVTGAYYAVFHAISAFCNAGFDLMGRFEPYTSLVPYRGDALVNLTVMTLIIVGGLGFVVWDDLIEHRLRLSRCRLHTKVVLVSTLILITLGAIMFYWLERDHSLALMNGGERLLASLFQSVTPRTAGFNTVDTAAMGEGGTVLSMLLMMIGASPGSTGGGMKTTTVVVIILSTVSYIRNSDDINLFHRRLDDSVLKRAYGNATIYLMLALSGIFLLMVTQGLPLKEVSFEVMSAIGTVGLSTGITRELNGLSRLIIIALMYSGRVGSLTLAMVLAARMSRAAGLRNPQEKIIVS